MNDSPTNADERKALAGSPRPASAPTAPLPWKAVDRGIGWEVHVSGTLECWCSEKKCGGEVNEGFRGTMSEADARFVVLAVNSHDALRDALRDLLETVEAAGFGGRVTGQAQLLKRARAALAATENK